MSTHFYDYPPPWVADDNRPGYEGLITVFDANGKPVVITGDMESAGMADIRNAHLFAAAPDLLTQLKLAHEDVCSLRCPAVWASGDRQPHSDLCVAIRAAITKAETITE
mgnify:CR=1 FL=1